MINDIQKTLMETDNRYPSDDEYARIQEAALELPRRIATARAVEALEEEVTAQTVDRIRELYAEFEREHNYAWSKCKRDVQLVLRHQVQAMLLNDVSVLDQKVLFWLRTIFASFTFEGRMCADTYGTLRDLLAERLEPAEYQHMQPFLDRTVDVLKDMPAATDATS